MELLSWLALFFVTLAGYSAGAVLGFRTNTRMVKGDPSPNLLDTITVVVLWIAAITSRLAGVKPWSAVGIWLVIALVVAFMMNWVQPQPSEGKPLPQ